MQFSGFSCAENLTYFFLIHYFADEESGSDKKYLAGGHSLSEKCQRPAGSGGQAL